VVAGTGTDVGKTWVAARLLSCLRAAGVTVAARKPAQSFHPDGDPSRLDSAVLASSTGELSETVCPRNRWYEMPMAPPMAAEALGRARFTTAELVEELAWPDSGVEVGLVESAGGVRSPLTHDGDTVAFVRALSPDLVLLVADAGLGTINAVRMSMDALAVAPHCTVVLNRFDGADDLHVRNRRWLTERDALQVVTMPGEETAVTALVRGMEA
jgi:dethiobiotin synthetase